MEVFGRSGTLVRYKSWLRVGRVHVSLEASAEALPGFDHSYGSEERWWCRVEANAARLTDPNGWQGCRVDIARGSYARSAFNSASAATSPAPAFMLEAEHENDPSRMQYDCPGDAPRRNEPLGHLFLGPMRFSFSLCACAGPA